MREFTYVGLPSRVVFGAGTRMRLPEEVRLLGAKRVLILATPSHAETARELLDALGAMGAGIYSGAVMHTPVHVTEDTLARVRALGADALVALGGGSTIGLSKALALRTDLPQVVIPTTYAGSEMTPILGETRGGEKTTQRTLEVLPESVIYDVDLTLSLPARISAASAINAMAHAVEALYARNHNPVTSLMAEEAIRALRRGLLRIMEEPSDLEARSDALYGAWLAASCLATAEMALHHKLAHVLGGSFDLPHAETHAVLLPHTAAYNAPAAPEALRRVATALEADDAASGLFALNARLGLPQALRDLGMHEEGIGRAAELAVKSPYWNPRPLVEEELRALIARAWSGDPPQPHED